MPSSQSEEKAAMAVAQALLGSLPQQPFVLPPPPAAHAAVPPQVDTIPQGDDAQNQTVEPHGDDIEPHADTPPPDMTEQNQQSTDQLTPRHRLLSRLLRALPIASVAQLTDMINVFDPNRDDAPPRNTQVPQPLTHPPQPPPGGLPQTNPQSHDPLQHLLARSSQKRSGLTK